MAEILLFSIADQILGKLASAAFQHIGLAVGVNRDLKKLEEILSTVQVVLLDAEKKQSTNRQLSHWIERFKHTCYDADDLLDEFAYEALRRQVATRGSLKTKVSNFFLHSNLKFRFVMGSKIKEIRERLDEIVADKVKFHLSDWEVDNRHVVSSDEYIGTHPFVQPPDVIGRDTDRENIVDLLTLQNIDKKLFVIPIVGLGGMGKTTLAKLVYNDERVNDCFQLKIWVCVLDDDFNQNSMIKAIIEAATGDKCSDLSIHQLKTRLRDTLRDKKFLLVLNDVWNDNREKWNKLRALSLDGANGSKIVATTRSHSIASIMEIVPSSSYILKGLSDEDCWSLFVKCAFQEGQEKQHPNLERIGKEIVKKCHGVPLAVISLGSMLFMKTDERDWKFIQENEIWRLEQKENDILPTLKMSYDHLPSYLKQCFALCSIFPKDYVFNNTELVQMWMAQGFIQPYNESEEYEDIGNRYIKELMSISFFQDIEENELVTNFKMHDLIRNLALLVTRSECYTISDSPPRTYSSISHRVRHVSFSDSLFTSEVPRLLLGVKNLRTIFFPSYRERDANKFFVETCITRFKYIRMLDLRNSSFKVLPSSVGSLKHLRHLDLSKNDALKRLSNSVCKLLHLQYLGLLGCTSLEELPRDIGNLTRLRRLDVTIKQMTLQPNKGIGSLSSLRFLCIIGCPNLIELAQGMKCLTSLRTLELWECKNLEYLPRSVKHLSSLECLSIHDCEKLNSMELEDDVHDLRLMRLRSLLMSNLPQLKALPLWLQKVSNTLQVIHIAACPSVTTLPEWFQNLTSLQQLVIGDCRQLSALPKGMQHLTSLRQLEIKKCPELNRRCKMEIGEDWHKISHVPQITLDEETTLGDKEIEAGDEEMTSGEE